MGRPPEQMQSSLKGGLPTQIPESLWRDNEVRTAVEHALVMGSQDVLEVTKFLYEEAPIQLISTVLCYPYVMPPRVFTEGCRSSKDREQDMLIRDFVDDGYMALRQQFGESEWTGWFVAPYFLSGNDSGDHFALGLFVGQYL